MRRLLPDPFLLWLVGTVLLATLLPAKGAVAIAVGWLATATVLLLFFFHGAKLAREQVVAGVTAWRLHLVVLLCTFGLFPIAGLALAHGLPGLLPAPLWTGLLFVCALPSTVQSSIAFVSVARGNVAAAVAAASASQLMGVVLTPVLMGLMAPVAGGGGTLGGIGKVAAQVFIPFAAGHLLRPWIGGWVARHRRLVGTTDRATILVSVYAAFSAAVLEGVWHRLPAAGLARLAGVDAALLAGALGATWALGRALRLPRGDRIVLLFCGTKKSLVQGVPMARVLFPGAAGGVVLLPIMLFHQLQLMACAAIAQRFARDAAAD